MSYTQTHSLTVYTPWLLEGIRKQGRNEMTFLGSLTVWLKQSNESKAIIVHTNRHIYILLLK